MILQIMQVGPLGVNCYIVGDDATREVLVIDPGGNARQIAEMLTTMGVKIRGIVLTHGHFDHLMGIEALKRETKVPLYAGANEKELVEHAPSQGDAFGLAVPPVPEPEHWVKEGDVIPVGDLKFKVLDVPGHSPGSIVLYDAEDGVLFAGDVLMRGTIGRTDLPGGSLADLLRGIKEKLYTLPNGTKVYSGHGPMTTIGEEKEHNPFTKNYV